METASGQKTKYKKVLFAMGMIIAAAVIVYAIVGFFDEMKQNLREGTGAVMLLLLTKILAGSIMAGIMASPYILGRSLINKTKNPLYLFIGCIAIFPIYIYLIVDVIVYPGTSSTSVVAIPFYAIFSVLLVLIIWGLSKIVELVKKT